jgi:hypothetical protein
MGRLSYRVEHALATELEFYGGHSVPTKIQILVTQEQAMDIWYAVASWIGFFIEPEK